MTFLTVGKPPYSIETNFLLAFRSPGDPSAAIGPAWTLPLIKAVTRLADGYLIATLTVLGAIFFIVKKYWINVGILLAAVIGEAALTSQLKVIFGKLRPDVVPHFVEASSFSFPSGHSTSAVAFYFTMAVLLLRETENSQLRGALIFAAAAAIFLVGFSRVFLGVHYPSDVLGGWALGAAWASLVLLAAHYIQTKGAASAY